MTALTILAITAAAAAADVEKLQQEYVSKLTAAASTANAQYQLAAWAQRAGLKELAAGHYLAAVHLDPSHEAAQRALGRVMRDGQWETKDERARRLAEEERLRGEFAMWRWRLAEKGLAAASERPISESAAAAIEQFAVKDAGRSLEAASIFGDSNSGAATISLVRQAMASPFANARTAAAKALCSHNPDHYLSLLLAFVRQENTVSLALGAGEILNPQDGSTVFAPYLAEARERKRFLDSRRLPADAVMVGSVMSNLWVYLPPLRDERLEERRVAPAELRTNAAAALAIVTGREKVEDYAVWRQVVMQATDAYIDPSFRGQASGSRTYEPEELPVGATWFRVGLGSCFAAGTPVAAKRGVVPIDQIRLGELVLSRNTETGETAYKPIVGRTLRPRVPMRKLTVGDETIIATAGHPFWTEQRGWVKTKALAKGATLGAEDGGVRVGAIEETSEPMQAYNLVVADFGTYFVGKNRVLVHDNTPIR